MQRRLQQRSQETPAVPDTDAFKDLNALEGEAANYLAKLAQLYQKRYHTTCLPVSVRLTGRHATRQLGVYDVKMRQITVHEAGMSDYVLRDTLIHELAHHVQYTSPLVEGKEFLPVPGAVHGRVFKIHYWRLRRIAAAAKMIQPIDELDPDLNVVAEKIRGLRRKGGQCVLEIGEQLAQARTICRQNGAEFEHFLSEFVAFDRTTAYDYIRAFEMKMPASINFTTMRFLMRLKDVETRGQAVEDAQSGVPLFVLRVRYQNTRQSTVTDNEVAQLVREKTRLTRRIAEIDAQLNALGYANSRTQSTDGAKRCV